MNDLPLVSIVIPVYNGSDFLEEAIDSALNQTYKNIEILVINDGSDDDGKTRDIALNYGDKILYFEKNNEGVASALNLGIKKMRGAYFSWLSHDDVYMPKKIETQIDYLMKFQEWEAILYSDFCYIGKNSEFISEYKVKHLEPDVFRLYFIMGGIINGCTLLIPKKCFEEQGVFSCELRTTQDYDLWFRFSEKFKFIHLSEILIKSRIHPNQDSLKLRPVVIDECNNLHLHFIKSIKRKEIGMYYTKSIPIYYFDFALNMMSQGYKKPMKYSFIMGLLCTPYLKLRYLRIFIRNARVLFKEVVR